MNFNGSIYRYGIFHHAARDIVSSSSSVNSFHVVGLMFPFNCLLFSPTRFSSNPQRRLNSIKCRAKTPFGLGASIKLILFSFSVLFFFNEHMVPLTKLNAVRLSPERYYRGKWQAQSFWWNQGFLSWVLLLIQRYHKAQRFVTGLLSSFLGGVAVI